MRDYSLLKAFIGGHYPTETAADGPGAHLFRNGNDRDKALIFMLDKQLKYRRQEAESIRRTNNANTNLLLNELEIGNQELGRIRSAISELNGSIDRGFSEISDKLDVSNGLLDELNWRLGQATSLLGDILDVLKNSRRNEAKQLVEQGVRFLLFNKYRDAEERFRLAFKYDKTDYQVLMNLGFIEVTKGNADKALECFIDASTLPSNINDKAKAIAIWNVARVFYAKKEFDKAYSYAIQAAKKSNSKNLSEEDGQKLLDRYRHNYKVRENLYEQIRNQNDDAAEGHFQIALYACLADRKDICLKNLRESIALSPRYFTVSIGHPDLSRLGNELINFLNQISDEYKGKVKAKIRDLDEITNRLNGVMNVEELVQRCENLKLQARAIMKNDNFQNVWNFTQLKTDIALRDIGEIFNQSNKFNDNILRSENEILELKREYQNKKSSKSSLNTLIAFLVLTPILMFGLYIVFRINDITDFDYILFVGFSRTPWQVTLSLIILYIVLFFLLTQGVNNIDKQLSSTAKKIRAKDNKSYYKRNLGNTVKNTVDRILLYLN